jgi:hypothetical protein
MPELLAPWEVTLMGRIVTAGESLPPVDFSAASASPDVWFARTLGSLLREITLMEFAIPPT